MSLVDQPGINACLSWRQGFSPANDQFVQKAGNLLVMTHKDKRINYKMSTHFNPSTTDKAPESRHDLATLMTTLNIEDNTTFCTIFLY